MRFLIKLLAILVLLWSGWWALATYGATKALNKAIENRRAAGWEVNADTAQSGFPMNIQTNVMALNLVSPVSQSRLSLSGAALKARTYWPGYIDLDLAPTPITLDLPAGQMALEAQDARAALRLRPGLALELGSLRLTSAAWRVVAYHNELLESKDFTLLAVQNDDVPARYDVTLNANGVTPSVLPRRALSLPATWPNTFDSFTATGAVTFDSPLTKASLSDRPPQLRGITIKQADVTWGPLALRANGDLKIDAAGIPSGKLDVQARNWRELLDLLQAAGTLPADQRGQVELMLGLLASRAGRPEDMDLDLDFKDGRMTLSGIPLGPAPRLVLP